MKNSLTEQDGQMFLLLDEHVEHFIGDIFDLVALDLTRQPLEHFLLLGQITCPQKVSF